MSVANILSDYLSKTKEEGIYIDSITLNELPYYSMEEREIDKVNKVELFDGINKDIIFMTSEDKVLKFFEGIFTDAELISHFNINFRWYVDLTKQGDVELNVGANVGNLSQNLILSALIDLIGKEKLEDIIYFYSSINFTISKALQDRLKFELESIIKENFKPLAERSAKIYEEFELAMTQ